MQFASLTDIIYQTWAGKTAKEYKKFKGLKKENLRDNMTNTELVLNMLAELSTKRISETTNPETMNEHSNVARQGGEIARNARLELEAKTGENVISPLNAKHGLLFFPPLRIQVITDFCKLIQAKGLSSYIFRIGKGGEYAFNDFLHQSLPSLHKGSLNSLKEILRILTFDRGFLINGEVNHHRAYLWTGNKAVGGNFLHNLRLTVVLHRKG